jgi:hypothetical protein
MKVYSLTKSEAGFDFQISSNSLDGGVLIVTQNTIFSYFSVKYFSSAEQGRKWIDSMVNNARGLSKYIIGE